MLLLILVLISITVPGITQPTKMYVANYTGNTISQANLDGSGGVSLGNLNGTLNILWGIALGTAPSYPEIDVQRPAGTSIPDGGTDDVGTHAVGPVNIVYTIDNSVGTGQLDIAGVTALNMANCSG